MPSSSYLVAQEQSYRYSSVPGDGLTPGHCYIEVAAYGFNVDGSDGDIQISMEVLANANGRCTQDVVDSKLPTIFAASETGNSGWHDVSGCGTHMLAEVTTTDTARSPWLTASTTPDQAAGHRAHLRERALAVNEAVYGTEHAMVATNLNNQAILLAPITGRAGGRPAPLRARPAIRQRLRGPGHPPPSG